MNADDKVRQRCNEGKLWLRKGLNPGLGSQKYIRRWAPVSSESGSRQFLQKNTLIILQAVNWLGVSLYYI